MTANTAPFQLTAKSIWPYAVSAALMITLGHTCVSSFLDYRKWIAFGELKRSQSAIVCLSHAKYMNTTGKGAPPGCDNAYGYCLFRLQKLFLLLVRDKGTTDTSFARKYPESTRFLALKESRSGRRPDMVPW